MRKSQNWMKDPLKIGIIQLCLQSHSMQKIRNFTGIASPNTAVFGSAMFCSPVILEEYKKILWQPLLYTLLKQEMES